MSAMRGRATRMSSVLFGISGLTLVAVALAYQDRNLPLAICLGIVGLLTALRAAA